MKPKISKAGTDLKEVNIASLATLVEAQLSVEKIRVQTQVRQSHLKLQNRTDPETDQLLIRVNALEEYVDNRVGKIIMKHPAYPWFSRVKGVGGENIGKVVGLCRVKPESGFDKDGEPRELPYAATISGLWQYCGYGLENGVALHRTKGEALVYNSELRSMCWRLGSSLLRAKGKFYGYYVKEKEKDVLKFINSGVKIIPASQMAKKDGKKFEAEGTITEGHIHNRALRKMIKLFLSLLWISWRTGEGLSLTEPYAIGQLKHDSMITPEDMVDR